VGGLIVVNLLASLITLVVLQLAGMFIFSKMTPYKEQEEVNKGNIAVALAMGGQFLATAIILCAASLTNTSIWFVALWFLIGFVCLLLTYFVFDWLTPGFKLSKQLQEGNVAVGVLLAFVYVGIGLTISTIIS
jgi:putative membrane protein